MTLFEYFKINWDRKPYPVVDHSLRMNQEADGSFTFYIHPANTDGVTSDFVVTITDIKPRF